MFPVKTVVIFTATISHDEDSSLENILRTWKQKEQGRLCTLLQHISDLFINTSDWMCFIEMLLIIVVYLTS